MIGDSQMTVSGNNVYIVDYGSYWGSNNGAVLFMASHDGGSTFDHVTISNDTMVFTPQLAVSGNNIYIVWMEMKGQVTSLFLKKSTNGGIDFSDKIKLDTQSGDVRWPKLVLVNGTGTDDLYVEWTQTLQSGQTKLFLAKSMDSGNTFDTLDLGGFTTGDFDFSQIGALGNNTIYAIWTGEYDPSYSHSGVFFRKSTDGGETFGNIFDLNSANKSGISNPIVFSSQNHIYVAGDSGVFRASSDLGSTFTYVANLDTMEQSKASAAEPLLLVPEFKKDIPTLEPANSQFSNSQNASFVLGQPDFVSNSKNPTASTFFTPHFIVFDSQGDLWVSDGGNDRVLEFKSPFKIGESASIVLGQSDFTAWQVLDGTTPKSLWHPQGLAFDSQGNLWVADGGSNRVLEFTPPFKIGQTPLLVLGHTDFTSGSPAQPSTNNSIYYPGGVTFDSNGNLWVADTSNRLLEFKPPFSNGQNASLILGNFASDQGVSAGMVSQPLGIAFDKNGNLWVADSGNYRVLRFDAPFSSGQAASLVLGHQDFTTGGEGVSSSANILRDPYGIAFDEGENLWVTDSGNNRVLEFTAPFTNGQNASLILGQTIFNAGAINTAGNTASSLDQPHGIAFDKNGNLWVADSENNRILVYASNQANNTVEISYPNSGIALTNSSVNSDVPNAYDKAASNMENCSKKLSIASDNQTALDLVLHSSEFQSKIQGYDYESEGIMNSFHQCTLDTIQVVYSLSDKNGTYVKSLYVSVDPSLTKILGITEETNDMSFGGSIASVTQSPIQKNSSNGTDADIVYKSTPSGDNMLILAITVGSIIVSIIATFLIWFRRK